MKNILVFIGLCSPMLMASPLAYGSAAKVEALKPALLTQSQVKQLIAERETDDNLTHLLKLMTRDLASNYTPDALYYILDRIALILAHNKTNEEAYTLLYTIINRQDPELTKKMKLVLEERIRAYSKS